MMDENTLVSRNIHAPKECGQCGEKDPEYKGVGEYKCRKCGHVMYDDFGVVRNYLEEHRGATASEVSHATGVAMETIRYFLKEDRLEIAQGSGVMMSCEICGASIRSGRYCDACSKALEHKMASEKAGAHKSNLQGYGAALKGESGARRFIR